MDSKSFGISLKRQPMKFLAILFAIVPFFGKAQFFLNLSVVEADNSYESVEAGYRIGDESGYSGRRTTNIWLEEISNLDDTLWLSALGYRFEQLPLKEYPFRIVSGRKIELTVKAARCVGEHWSINVFKAKKAPRKDDSLSINLFREVSADEIRLVNSEDRSIGTFKKKGSQSYRLRVSRRDLSEGFLVARTGEKLDSMAFKPEDRLAMIDWLAPVTSDKCDGEFDLFRMLVEAREEHDRKINELEAAHREREWELEEEIRKLKGEPLAPEPEVEVEPVMIDFPMVSMEPIIGMGKFYSGLRDALAEFDVKHEHSVTVKLIVYRDGRAKGKVVEGNGTIGRAMIRYAQQQRYRPEERAGRRRMKEVLLTVNFKRFE